MINQTSLTGVCFILSTSLMLHTICLIVFWIHNRAEIARWKSDPSWISWRTVWIILPLFGGFFGLLSVLFNITEGLKVLQLLLIAYAVEFGIYTGIYLFNKRRIQSVLCALQQCDSLRKYHNGENDKMQPHQHVCIRVNFQPQPPVREFAPEDFRSHHYPAVSDLIFHTFPNLSAEEIVEQALSYKPIALQILRSGVVPISTMLQRARLNGQNPLRG